MDFLYTPNAVAGFFFTANVISLYLGMNNAILGARNDNGYLDVPEFEIIQTKAGLLALLIGAIMSPIWKEFYYAIAGVWDSEDFLDLPKTLQSIDWTMDPIVSHIHGLFSALHENIGIPHAISGLILMAIALVLFGLSIPLRIPGLLLVPAGYIAGFWAIPLFLASLATLIISSLVVLVAIVMLLVGFLFFGIITGTVRF